MSNTNDQRFNFIDSESGQELNELIPDGMTYDTYFELLREAFKAQDKEAKRFSYGIARHTTIKTDANVRIDLLAPSLPERALLARNQY